MTKTCIAVCLLGCALATDSANAQFAEVPRDDYWLPALYGQPAATFAAAADGVIYLGGDLGRLFSFTGDGFDSLIPAPPAAGSLIDVLSGGRDPDFPEVQGQIYAAAPDGEGGWIVGGLFSAVGGVARKNLARIGPDKLVDPNWEPAPDDIVTTLAVNDEALYVGGKFNRIGGQARQRLARLGTLSGTVEAWNPTPDGEVSLCKVAAERLYVSGNFRSIGGLARSGIAAFAIDSGALLSWSPAISLSVFAIATRGNAVYLGGHDFNGPSLIAVDVTTAARLNWNPNPQDLNWSPPESGSVYDLIVYCDAVYAAGFFHRIGGLNRTNLAALNPNTGQALPFNSRNHFSAVNELGIAANTLYVSGDFTDFAGIPRRNLAALDASAGLVLPWQPRTPVGFSGQPSVRSSSIWESELVVFGNNLFTALPNALDGVPRRNLAAIDAATGSPTPWRPTADGPVLALEPSGNRLYVGGAFVAINSQPRYRLAALDGTTGALMAWQPNLLGRFGDVYNVNKIVTDAETVYTSVQVPAGFFGFPVSLHLAAIDTLTGAIKWAIKTDSDIIDFVLHGQTIYLCGNFTRIGDQPRGYLAALDARDGTLLPWNPGASTSVFALTVSDGVLYVGGYFLSITGQARRYLAAFDITGGQLLPWDPDPNGPVTALANCDGTVFSGGEFTDIGGRPRHFLAALSTVDGHATEWSPEVGGGAVYGLGRLGDSLYARGAFSIIGGRWRPGFAVFPPEGSPVVERQPRHLRVAAGHPATFDVQVSGEEPFTFQWQHNGTDLPGATTRQLRLPNVQRPQVGEYRVIVTNPHGLRHSAPARLTLAEPPVIVKQPVGQIASAGSNISLTVEVTGDPPPAYQWRLNGVSIPAAVFQTLALTNLQPADSGVYTVVAANLAGSATSSEAEVIVPAAPLAMTDAFAAAPIISAEEFTGRTTNLGATRELGEPDHAGKRGNHSIWLTWVAPTNGIAVFTTQGSSIDTLLAVYLGDRVDGLTNRVADDDSGGFGTSLVAFNAEAGRPYRIAVDGFFGDAGAIVLSWKLDAATDQLPRILIGPRSDTVAAGTDISFTVVASPDGLSYQWLFNCEEIPGATNATLQVDNVGPAQVGLYAVIVSNSAGMVQSEPALLQVNRTGNAVVKTLARDKLADVLEAPQVLIRSAVQLHGPRRQQFVSVAQGTIGVQIFNTFGATSDRGEPNHCATLGGASYWFAIRAENHGLMSASTEGSDFDTVLAVYEWSGNIVDPKFLVACDDNSGRDGADSFVRFEARAGTIYYFAVDGVKGATGVVRLGYALDQSVKAEPSGESVQAFTTSFGGVTGRSYRLQASTDLERWYNLRTVSLTNSAAALTDTNAFRYPSRFYRVVPVP